MSSILWLELEGFYASQQPSSDLPLLIVRDGLVLDGNALARSRGVRPGMPLRQAKAIVIQSRTVPWKAGDYSTDWLDLCTDYSGVIEPLDQHCAAIDLSRHPDPLDIAEQLVQRVSRETGLHVVFGHAPSKWIAELSALKQDLGLAQANPREFLAALPVRDLSPVPVEIRARLEFLGYQTIGTVAELPLSVLTEQFAQLGWTISKAARGEWKDEVAALYPNASLHDCLYPQGELESVEEVDLCLQSLVGNLGQRLIERGLQGSTLELSIDFETITHPQPSTEFSRTFTKPLHSPQTLLIAMRLLVERQLDQPVTGIRVALRDLKPRKQRQVALHGLNVTRSNPDQTIKQVQQVFGETSILRASEIPVPRRIRVLREWQRATGWY